MKRNILILSCFLLQILLVFSPVFKSIYIKTKGELWYFEAKLLDPRDLLRGHYLVLDFPAQKIVLSEEDEQKCNHYYQKFTGEKRFYLQKNEQNFAEIAPNGSENNNNFLIFADAYCYNQQINLRFPFKRYYLNEYLAQSLENPAKKFKLGVWIYRGDYVVEKLHEI